MAFGDRDFRIHSKLAYCFSRRLFAVGILQNFDGFSYVEDRLDFLVAQYESHDATCKAAVTSISIGFPGLEYPSFPAVDLTWSRSNRTRSLPVHLFIEAFLLEFLKKSQVDEILWLPPSRCRRAFRDFFQCKADPFPIGVSAA